MKVSVFQLCEQVMLGLTLAFASPLTAQERAVINDPDGFTNVRKEQGADSEVVARVKAGEVFEYESSEGSPWWKVTLASGKSGWMHSSRIRLYFTLDEMPEKDEEGAEVTYYGQAHGFAYSPTARAAAQGDPAAIKRFFGINDIDGGAAESHAYYVCKVMHLLGDEKLAAFLRTQPLAYRLEARKELISEIGLWPFEELSYTERNFPQTFRLLCQKEITDWISPDGKYAITKMFSEARVTPDSKVVKALLIEKSTGKAILDLTAADVGRGTSREGRVMWSPDARRFAYFSGDVGMGAQTVVFQRAGDSFTRVALPSVELPGRKGDEELKGAEHLWQFVEPQRWESPDTLIMLHHDYFEKLRADRSINSIGRTYLITYDLGSGSAVARVKNHDEE